MKCISCNADVPPQWVHALNSNICPGCGKDIMNDDTKTLLVELREAMAQMPNDPEGLAGWLISNYNLKKVGSGEPTNFHRAQEKHVIKAPKPVSKVSETSDDAEEVIGEKIGSDERAKLFQKNAGAPDNSHIAELAKKLKEKGVVGGKASVPVISDEDGDDYDAESMGDEDDVDFDPDTAGIVNMLAKDGDSNELKKHLELQKLKNLQAKQKMRSGTGSFSRSS